MMKNRHWKSAGMNFKLRIFTEWAEGNPVNFLGIPTLSVVISIAHFDANLRIVRALIDIKSRLEYHNVEE